MNGIRRIVPSAPGEVHTDSKLLMTFYAGILAMICALSPSIGSSGKQVW